MKRVVLALPRLHVVGSNYLSRLVLGILSVWVLVHLAGAIFNFGWMIVQTRQTAALMKAPPAKFSASAVELRLRETNALRLADPSRQDLHCNEGSFPWDYVCSFVVVTPPPPARMHFGVRVNSNNIVEYSTVTPIGVAFLPLPKAEAGQNRTGKIPAS